MRAELISFARRSARKVIGRPILGRSILTYHRIANTDFDPWNIAVSSQEFERQLLRLRSKTVLPLQEFARLQIRDRLPRNAVAIHGYACNAVVAAPMLEIIWVSCDIFYCLRRHSTVRGILVGSTGAYFSGSGIRLWYCRTLIGQPLRQGRHPPSRAYRMPVSLICGIAFAAFRQMNGASTWTNCEGKSIGKRALAPPIDQ